MNKTLCLFIDESGIVNPKSHKRGCYILCGCLIPDSCREQLRIKSDQIKFKFWNKTNIIFHSREIWRKEGEFSILKEEEVNKQFQDFLFDFLRNSNYQIFAVVVDSNKALRLNWDDKKVYKETSDIMVKNFILSLLATKSRGRLVIESASSEKDFYFHKAASHYLAKGLTDLKILYSEIQDVLTEIAFVTKKNFDIEEQIADLLAYGAKLKFFRKQNKNLSGYDKEILKIINQKLFIIHPQTGDKKRSSIHR